MQNAVCLNSNTYHGFALDDALEGARRVGIRYIELSAVADWTEHVWPTMTDDEIAAVKDQLAESGVTAIGLSAHANLTTSDGRARFRANLTLASRFGVGYVVTGTGETHGDEAEIDDQDALVDDLRTLAILASTLSLSIAIETHGANFNTGERVKTLVERVAAPNLGIAYDTGNVIFYASVEPYDDLERSASHVLAFHLKDKAGAPHEWNFPALGDGNLDLDRFASILERAHCNAPLSIEIEFTPTGPVDVEEVHTALQHSVRAIAEVGAVR